MDVSKVDKNFRSYYSFEGMVTFDVNDTPFKLYGLSRQEGETDFKRMPSETAQKFKNDSIKALHTNTSGIRVRFRTDSKRIVLKCILPSLIKAVGMPVTGASCFDLYADGRYCTVFRPAMDINGKHCSEPMRDDGYTSGYVFPDKKMRDILIHFPLYNDVSNVYIALEEGAVLEAPKEYTYPKPVVFYGSSITQGGCASHGGNAYPAMISRRFDCDFINLGFSGGCYGEIEVAEYISTIDKSVFVYDYDHNAESPEFLEETHEKFFLRLREKNPDVPVVMVTTADLFFGEEMTKKRKEVIRRTFENAKARGDKNVYFVDGAKIYENVGLDFCTVDGAHANDHGFYHMANAIGEVIKDIL